MSRTYRKGTTGPGRDRHLSVRAVRRTPVDVRKLSRALIELAIAEAAAEADAAAATPPVELAKPEEESAAQKAPDD